MRIQNERLPSDFKHFKQLLGFRFLPSFNDLFKKSANYLLKNYRFRQSQTHRKVGPESGGLLGIMMSEFLKDEPQGA